MWCCRRSDSTAFLWASWLLTLPSIMQASTLGLCKCAAGRGPQGQGAAGHAMMQSSQQVGTADDMYSQKVVQPFAYQGQVRVGQAMHWFTAVKARS